MQNTENKKLSKLAVAALLFTILVYFGLFTTGAGYTTMYEVLSGIFFDIIFLAVFYYIMRMVKNKDLKGLLLAQISFYGLLGIVVVWTIATLVVAQKLGEVKSFATDTVPALLTEDLSGFNSYATEDLQKLITYDKEFKGYKEKIKEVGAVKECAFAETDKPSILFGPYISYGDLKVGYTGEFTIRCYGAEKAMIVGMSLKKINGDWKISDFAFNANITKNVDAEEQEKIKLSNPPAKE